MTSGKITLNDASNTNSVSLQAPATLASSVAFTLPDAYGSSGQALTTNGSGVLSWASTGASTAVVTLSAAQLAAQTSVEIVAAPSAGQYLLPTEVEALFTYGTALGAGDVTLKYSNQTLSTLTNLLSNAVNKQVAQNVTSLTPENSALYVKADLGLPAVMAPGLWYSSYTSIAIDSSGVPYVAFINGNNYNSMPTGENKPTVYKLVSGAWTLVGAAFGGSSSSYTSIAIDSAGVPYVAFIDGGNNYKPTVYKLVDGTWTLVDAAFGGSSSSYTSIAIDSSGVPYVAFTDGGNNNKPTVYKLVDGTWTLVDAAFGDNYALYTSIAIDSANVPYVAFKSWDYGGRSRVYKLVDGTWTLVGAAFGGGDRNYTSIAIDSANVPYVASPDYDNNYKTTVYKLVDGTWTLVGAAFGGNNSQYTSIAIDSAGVPYVAFADSDNSGKSTVYKLVAGTWTLVVVDAAFGGNNTSYTSIAIDSSGVPYVAFNDGGAALEIGLTVAAARTADTGATVKLRVHYQVLSLLT